MENQTQIHYAMPVRNMLYDAMGYAEQVEHFRKEHKLAGENGSSAEYLSGFHREDKLTPIITLVIYWGDGDFDAPTCLHEMFEPTDERILQYADNYRINLINPNRMEEEDFKKFHTEFGFVLNIIKNKNDAAQLQKTIEGVRNQKIGTDTVVLLNSLLKWNIPVDESEEEMDMCKGMEDLLSMATAQGREEGHMKGRKEGCAEGRFSAFLTTVRNLMETMNLTADQAMDILKIPEDEREGIKLKLSAESAPEN